VELREQGLWVRQRSVEILYGWSDLKSVEDRPSGIALRFGAGYVLVRSRAFATPDARDAFLAAAKARLAMGRSAATASRP
jgi:hypothetical protein